MTDFTSSVTTLSAAGAAAAPPTALEQSTPAPHRAPDGPSDPLTCGHSLLAAALASPTRQAAIEATLTLVEQLTGTAAIVYFGRNERKRLAPQHQVLRALTDDDFAFFVAPLRLAAKAACERGSAHVQALDADERLVSITVPVISGGERPDALSGVFVAAQQRIEPLVIVFELVAASISLWHARPRFHGEAAATRAEELLELARHLLDAADPEAAACRWAEQISTWLPQATVAVGLCRSGTQHCRLSAVSGVADVDRRSEAAAQLELVLQEAVLRGTEETCAPAESQCARATVAQRRLCAVYSAGHVLSAPLTDTTGRVAGAWLAVSQTAPLESEETLARLHGAAPLAASCLALAERAAPSPLVKRLRRARGRWWGRRGVAALAVLAVAAATLALPMPYRITASGVVQPVMRRYVAAPFDAKLEEALVEPGDLVKGGETLARLDGREVRWDLAGLTAEYNRARKLRETSLAGGEVADAQMAALDMERLALKIKLLEDRARKLDITSPIAGLVIHGDLKRTEGAPLTRGQVLFEIAPLAKMRIEVRIPDDEIAYVEPGQEVRIRLDAHRRLDLRGTLARIHPRAELQENENVFLGEVELDNPEQVLRPGMAGRAKIITPAHALGWNLFHKALEQLALSGLW